MALPNMGTGRPLTTGQGAARNWTLDAFAEPPPNNDRLGAADVNGRRPCLSAQVANLFALPWGQPSSPLNFKQTLGPVQHTLIYRIPSQGMYGTQINRTLQDAWARLASEWWQGFRLYMSFAFHPENT